ncbi:hypothetical protein [Microbulbifer sp.]|uniref:hypothetical protein n=1 Tax=Microbulbifer sp. TaxID=1908541 RepID=UPI003F418F45
MKLLFIFLAISVGILFLWATRSRKKKIRSRFISRSNLSFEELYKEYFLKDFPDKELVRELLEHVASYLDIPVGVLRPNDSFNKELKEEKGWEFDSGFDMLFIEMEEMAKKKDVDIESIEINTLKDYLKTMILLY